MWWSGCLGLFLFFNTLCFVWSQQPKNKSANIPLYTLYHCHWLSGSLPFLWKLGHQLLFRNIFHGILCTFNKLLLQDLPRVPHSSLMQFYVTFFELWLWIICLIYKISSNLWTHCNFINDLQQITAEMCILKICFVIHLMQKLKFISKN